MCSTIWLGDHLPGARGVPQADPSASASLMQLLGRLPARRERAVDLVS